MVTRANADQVLIAKIVKNDVILIRFWEHPVNNGVKVPNVGLSFYILLPLLNR